MGLCFPPHVHMCMSSPSSRHSSVTIFCKHQCLHCYDYVNIVQNQATQYTIFFLSCSTFCYFYVDSCLVLNFVFYVCKYNPIPKSPRELKTPHNTANMSNNSSASFFFFLEVFLLVRNGLGGLVSTSQELKKKKGDEWRSGSSQRNYRKKI